MVTEQKFSKSIVNIMIVGVGGQGVITIGKIFQEYALNDPNIVNMIAMESRGVSQREGSVYCVIRYRIKAQDSLQNEELPPISPILPQRQINLMLALDPLEFIRNMDYCSPDCEVLLNTAMQIPKSAISSKTNFFSEVEQKVRTLTSQHPAINIVQKNYNKIANNDESGSLRVNTAILQDIKNLSLGYLDKKLFEKILVDYFRLR